VRAGFTQPVQRAFRALYLTSSFVFKNAARQRTVFGEDRHGVSRYNNPTVAALQERLAGWKVRSAASPRLPECRAILAC